MEFTKEKAEEIIKRWELDAKTIKVWRTRGSIPDKYADPNYTPREKLNPKQKKDYERLMSAISTEKLYKVHICKQEGISYSKYMSAIRKDNKKVDLTLSETIAIKRNVNEFRIKIKNLIEPLINKTRFFEADKKKLDALLLDERFNTRSLLGEGQCYDRFIARNSPTQGTEIFEDWEATQMLDRLSVFLLETAN